MKLTLNISGLTFNSAFTTIVLKVTEAGDNSTIVLDAMKNVNIPIGLSAEAFGIKKDSQVTITPSATKDGTFDLELCHVKAPKAKQITRSETRGSSSAFAQRMDTSQYA